MKCMKISLIVLTTALFTSCNKDEHDNPYPPAGVEATVVKGSGDITNVLEDFRRLLGDPLNVAPEKSTGRREVNWDAVPATFTNNNNFPFDFFNSTDAAAPNGRKRGLILANSNNTFRVDSTDFSEIDPSYATQFDAFSPKRTFISVGTNVTDATFKLPGTNTDAFTKGFGVVFADVDYEDYSYIEYFQGTKSLGSFKVPPSTNQSNFSFLGVYFPNNKVTRVKITSGNGSLAKDIKDVSNEGLKDLVVMDDFLYSEPKAQ